MRPFTKVAKSAFAVVLAISLMTSTLGIVMAEQMGKLKIVALGDSLAAGRTPYGGNDKSYTDNIAEKADKTGRLQSFDKRYAADGYTTENVLQDILNDKKRDVEGSPDTLGIRETLRRADIVTLDAGANDLLNALGPNLEADSSKISKVMGEVGGNLLAIVTEIKKLNPSAHVYVMGYYNSYPYLPQDKQTKLLQVLELLNKTIEGVARKSKAIYIPTAEIIARDNKTYLPNNKDIHLSATGYQAIADAFWKEMQSLFTTTGAVDTTEKGNEPPATEVKTDGSSSNKGKQMIHFTDIANHWAEDYIKDAGERRKVSGYLNGEFKPDRAITRKEFMVMLINILGLKEESTTITSFADDDQIRPWGKQAISQVVQLGIANKDGGGKFRPNEQLLYAEMMQMIIKTGKLLFNDVTITGLISDEAISQWVKDSVEKVYKHSIPNGHKVTRAQTLVILLQMLEHKNKVTRTPLGSSSL